jgi:hypothetical protein
VRCGRLAGGAFQVPNGLDRLLEFLADHGVPGVACPPVAPVEVLAERYCRWLMTERGLADAKVVRCVPAASRSRSVVRARESKRDTTVSVSDPDQATC